MSATFRRVDRKRALADSIIERYGAIASRSRALREHPESVVEVILKGSARARAEAARTMSEVRKAINMSWE